ncbi:MAG: nitroreductase family protein [Myxococcota bacterium]|jgi:nitroreductase|nr:nitroreductase family protein [Myxococcota bacterium]
MAKDWVIKAIERRKSCRSYTEQELDEQTRSQLLVELSRELPGPFGHSIRLQLLEAVFSAAEGGRRLGTYGVIRNARHFIAGAIDPNEPGVLEDYGHALERVILRATALGLGTCWLGASFQRGLFEEVIGAAENQRVAAVTPVGYMASRRSLVDATMVWMAGSKKRKPWSELFFEAELGRPLDERDARAYAGALEMLRLAPSASNLQPWRVVHDAPRRAWHFFLQRSRGYVKLAAVDLQRIDMGIAMLHFEMSCDALSLRGTWQDLECSGIGGRNVYVRSWVESA